jgi:hypothetical protein
MKARFQILVGGVTCLDTELQVRNRWTALHELLLLCGVPYDATQFKERHGWVQFETDEGIYRTSTRFG